MSGGLPIWRRVRLVPWLTQWLVFQPDFKDRLAVAMENFSRLASAPRQPGVVVNFYLPPGLLNNSNDLDDAGHHPFGPDHAGGGHRSDRDGRHAGDAHSHPFHSEAEPMARNVRRNLSASSPK